MPTHGSLSSSTVPGVLHAFLRFTMDLAFGWSTSKQSGETATKGLDDLMTNALIPNLQDLRLLDLAHRTRYGRDATVADTKNTSPHFLHEFYELHDIITRSIRQINTTQYDYLCGYTYQLFSPYAIS